MLWLSNRTTHVDFHELHADISNYNNPLAPQLFIDHTGSFSIPSPSQQSISLNSNTIMGSSQPIKYAKSASKGFSYLVPVSVQDALLKLLKKLPFTARDIYRKYYRDLMAAKRCAPDSAQAMAKFVEESFPSIRRKHNRLARLMNEAIQQDEHHGYYPTLFPIVGSDADGDEEETEEEIEVSKTKKRQAVTPASSSRSKNKRRKTTKTVKKTATAERLSYSTWPVTVHEEGSALQYPTPAVPQDDASNTDGEDAHQGVRKNAQELNTPPTSSPSKQDSGIDIEEPEDFDNEDDYASDSTNTPEPWRDSLWPYGEWVDDF